MAGRGGWRKAGKFRKVAIRQAATLGGRVTFGSPDYNGGVTGWVTCPLCEEPVDLTEATVDHIKPTSRNGTDAIKNMRLTHKKCNELRGNPEEESHDDRIARAPAGDRTQEHTRD